MDCKFVSLVKDKVRISVPSEKHYFSASSHFWLCFSHSTCERCVTVRGKSCFISLLEELLIHFKWYGQEDKPLKAHPKGKKNKQKKTDNTL